MLRSFIAAALVVALVSSAGPALGQGLRETFSEDAFPSEEARRPPLEVPALAFRLELDVPLEGPLSGRSLGISEDGSVSVPLESAVALVDPVHEGNVRLLTEDPRDADAEADPWVLEPGRNRRFRSMESGHVLAQKCCGFFGRRWHRIWKLRIPGGVQVPPLASPGRVYVGAMDNQIYGLRSRNGHRLWTTDLGRRVSRPLALWEGRLPLVRPDGTLTDERNARLVLALPDGGTHLIAIDSRSGRKVAVFQLPEGQGRMVGSPVVTGESRVAVARQRYTKREVTLIVLTLQVLPPEDGVSESASAPARP